MFKLTFLAPHCAILEEIYFARNDACRIWPAAESTFYLEDFTFVDVREPSFFKLYLASCEICSITEEQKQRSIVFSHEMLRMIILSKKKIECWTEVDSHIIVPRIFSLHSSSLFNVCSPHNEEIQWICFSQKISLEKKLELIRWGAPTIETFFI